MNDDIRALLHKGAEAHLDIPPDIDGIRRRAQRRRARGIASMVVIVALITVPALRFVDGLSNRTVRLAPAAGIVGDQSTTNAPIDNVCASVLGSANDFDPLGRLGLQDHMPRSLLRFGRITPGSCIVDPSGERVIGATVEVVSDGNRLLATWLLLPVDPAHAVDGAEIAMADPESALHQPDVRRQYIDGESAFVILEHSPVADDIAAIAADTSEDMVAVWDQLPRAASSSFDIVVAPVPAAQDPESATAAWRVGSSGLVLQSRHEGDAYVTEVVLNNGDVVNVVLGEAAQGTDTVSYLPTSSVSLNDPRTPRPAITDLAPRVVAQQECDAVGRSGGCKPVRQETLENGSTFMVWDVGYDEPLVTVALGDWTLVLEGPDRDLAHHIASGLNWSVDDRGFLRLHGATPSVHVGVGFTLRTLDSDDGGSLRLYQGCPPGAEEFERLVGAATWCTDGYLVEALSNSGTWQAAAHDSLAIVPAGGR